MVKWFLPEPGSDAALTIFEGADASLAPDHAPGEIGEVLLRAHRRGIIALDDVRRANAVVATRLVLRSPAPLVDRSTTIAVDASVSFYDALYVAAADLWTSTSSPPTRVSSRSLPRAVGPRGPGFSAVDRRSDAHRGSRRPVVDLGERHCAR